MKKHNIVVVAPNECGWGIRCVLHCRLLEDVEYDSVHFTLKELYNGEVDKNKFDFTKKFPQVYVDGKYIGGFYELVDMFPV